MNDFDLLTTLIDLTGCALSKRMVDVIRNDEKLSEKEIRAISDLSKVCNSTLGYVEVDKVLGAIKGLQKTD